MSKDLIDFIKITKTSNLIVILISPDLRILDSNSAFNTNFPKAEKLTSILLKEEIEKIEEIISQIEKSGIYRQIEIKFQKKKSNFWLKGEISKTLDKNYIIVGQDITDLKLKESELIARNLELENIKTAVLNLLEDMNESQESLKNANKELRKLDEMKNDFISIASHELRTPMTSIKGYISMILDGDAGEINKDVRSFLNEVYQSNERLVDLVNDMLDVSRIEQKRLNFEFKKVEALPLIKEAYERMLPMARNENDQLILEANIDKNLKINVDYRRFQQVITNLVENAIKFTEQGKVTILAKVKDKRLEVSVKDTGIGISKADQKKLFTKFYQVAQVLSRPKGGTGLGLYISKSIVEGMKGTIGLNSTPGKGSTFFFTIPIVK
jgi:signal transduction histidine kinase